MLPLLRLELRRQRSFALRMAIVTVLIILVFYGAGKRAPADILALVIGSSLGTILIVPTGISREKMEGTLDFVCGLPVEPRTIAASRFAAVALIPVPWAVAIGVTSAAVPAIGAVNPVVMAALAWLALTLAAGVGTALLTMYDLESLVGAPLLAFVVAAILVPRLMHALFPGITSAAVLQLLQRPAAPLAFTLVLLALVAIVGAVAFAITVRGFATYRSGGSAR